MSPHSRFAWPVVLALVGLAAAVSISAAQTTTPAPVTLAPHRAVYEITLDPKKPARSLDSASGRLAYDLTGDACTGYATTYRQVTILESAESGRRAVDTRMTTLEEPGQAGFRFKIDSSANGAVTEAGDGRARRQGAGYVVSMTRPRAEERKLSGEVVFPSEHLKRIIAAAQQGATTLAVKVFDGSEEGKLVYDTLTVIGAKLEGAAGLEEALREVPGMAAMPRWPVRVSYFKPGEGDRSPSYAVAFELFANGVSRAVKMDYTDFVLDAALSRLSLYPAPACEK